jgi:hypothetical protein
MKFLGSCGGLTSYCVDPRTSCRYTGYLVFAPCAVGGHDVVLLLTDSEGASLHDPAAGAASQLWQHHWHSKGHAVATSCAFSSDAQTFLLKGAHS